MNKKIIAFLRYFLPLVLILTAVCGLIYLVEQQSLRLGANDPQIQISEDIAAALGAGVAPESLISKFPPVDVARSLSPFIIIYDKNGRVVFSSGDISGKTPVLPSGIFAYVTANGEDRFTWELQKDVRNATVVTKYSGKVSGYVLVARSLREVEQREDQLLLQVGFVYLLSLFLSGALAFLLA